MTDKDIITAREYWIKRIIEGVDEVADVWGCERGELHDTAKVTLTLTVKDAYKLTRLLRCVQGAPKDE